jgi:amino acid transporter
MQAGAETPESHGLKRQLSLGDLVLTQILVVVGSAWVGVAGGLGNAQALVWIFAMVVFYLPMAVSVFYLNREMPLEGGLYVWARNAFGDTFGFMTAWNLWAYGICVIAAILSPTPREIAYMIGPSAAWLIESKPVGLSIVIFIVLLLAAAAFRGLGLGKWIHNVSGIAMLTVFALLILTPLWAYAHHVPLHYAPLAMHLPKADLYSFALIGQLVGALSGLEYIAIMAGETRDASRSIGQSVIFASPIICAMFILGTGSVVAFHERNPAIAIDFVAPIPQTLRLALGNSGIGSFIAASAIFLLQLRLIGAASVIFTGVTRLPMTAGWDHLIPEWFARLHPRYRTPTNSILFTCVTVIALVILGSLGVHAAEAFEVLNNASTELYSIAYLAMFAIPLIGAKALRERIPTWAAWTAAIGFLATAFSFLLTAYPFVDVVNPRVYAAKILGATALANLVGYAFYRSRSVNP